MKNASIALETWATDHGGDYTGLDGVTQDSPVLAEQGFNSTEWVSVAVQADVDGYCIQGLNSRLPEEQFVYRSTGGVVQVQLLGDPAC